MASIYKLYKDVPIEKRRVPNAEIQITIKTAFGEIKPRCQAAIPWDKGLWDQCINHCTKGTITCTMHSK